MKREYTLRVAGLTRQLKLYPISDALQIAAFILLGDAELTEACARELAAHMPEPRYFADGRSQEHSADP